MYNQVNHGQLWFQIKCSKDLRIECSESFVCVFHLCPLCEPVALREYRNCKPAVKKRVLVELRRSIESFNGFYVGNDRGG